MSQINNVLLYDIYLCHSYSFIWVTQLLWKLLMGEKWRWCFGIGTHWGYFRGREGRGVGTNCAAWWRWRGWRSLHTPDPSSHFAACNPKLVRKFMAGRCTESCIKTMPNYIFAPLCHIIAGVKRAIPIMTMPESSCRPWPAGRSRWRLGQAWS